MPDLSLKGISRKYLSRTPPLSLKDVLGVTGSGLTVNVRPRFESITREEHSFKWQEDCGTQIFGGTAAFLQVWTHIVVRINLNFDPAILVATQNNLMTTWKTAIQNAWSFKWGCTSMGESTCRLTFEVQWTSINPHHTVAVTVCTPGMLCRANAGRWFNNTTGATAAHEFGHLLGLKDEYQPTNPMECPIRNPVNTGTIMHVNTSTCFPMRLMNVFANNIISQIVPIPEYVYNPAICT